MVSPHNPVELTDEDRKRIDEATQSVVSARVYRDLARVIEQWKAEEGSRKAAALVVIALGALVVLILVLLIGLSWLSPREGPRSRVPLAVYPAEKATQSPFREYIVRWNTNTQAALSSICSRHRVSVPTQLRFRAFIEASGRTEKVEIEQSTGIAELDNALQIALLYTEQLPAFRPELRAVADALAIRGVVTLGGGQCRLS